MNFREFFRYELSYRLRQPSTWFYFALVWAGTIAIVHLTNPVPPDRVVNAPVNHAGIVVLLNFFAMVITAGIFGEAATRDAGTGMQSQFSTLPISKLDYLGGRFLASLLVNAVLLVGMPLMVALSYTFPWLGHFNWAPFRVALFAQPFLLFTLPNLFIAAAVAYTIASLTKNAMATYLGTVALAALYLIVVNQGLGNDTAENLIDPFALGALQRITSFWTPAERETRLLGFPGILVVNRVLWIAVASALLAFLYARYSFTHPGLRGRRRVQSTGFEEEPVRHAIVSVPRARREFAGRTRMEQLLEVARHSFRDITKNRLFLIIVLASIPWTWAIGWQVGAIVFDTDTWPVTHLVAGSLNGVVVSILMIFLISLVAGELVWREREVGAGDIGAAAPTPDWIPIAGRFLALVGVIAVLQLVYTLSGIGLQAAQGYYNFELLLWLKLMFGIQLVGYMIFAALAMAIHVVVNQKSLGHVVTLGLFVFMEAGGQFVPALYHNLVKYNGDPGIVYSDMSRFGPFLKPWAWFKSYWAAWALLLTVLATVFWIRSSEGGARARLRLAWVRLRGSAGWASLAAAVLILATGGFVFHNTNVLHDWETTEESRARAVAYEKAYRRFLSDPVPTVVGNTMRVEIYPERPAARLTGHFVLTNESSRAIDSVHIAMNDGVALHALAFAGGARLVLDDSTLRHRIYDLATPIAPGDSTRMTFDVEFAPRGFGNDRPPTGVVSNGSYFDRRWLPVFGYQPGREITGAAVRKELGLPPRAPMPGPADTGAVARSLLDDDGASYAHMDVTIGTAPDQIAVTPGKLVREWTDNGRRYFRYVTPTLVPHGAAVFSARYAVKDDAWRNVPLRIYYHPTHTFNVDRIIDAMQASLEYNSTAYGPYAYHELRVVEFPRYGNFARAHPHTVAFGEGSAFITRIDEDAGVDRPFFVIAHEVGHQWWGNGLRGARVRGGALLSESLASFTAMMTIEKTFGQPMAWRLFGYEMERYLGRRGGSDAPEVPLTHVSTESHLYYSKGAIAMYTMRDLIGEKAVNGALRRFYEKHADRTPPFPTSLDLLAELRAVTPDSLQSLVTDLFETITLWDFRNDTASAAPRPDGRWDVSLAISAKKVRADSLGTETEVPMNDLVEVGVFGETRADTIYLARHRIRSGTQTITVTVPRKPAIAGVDPFRKLVERQPARLKNVTIR